MLKGEETQIKLIFFFLGILLSLPSNIIINVSFLINNIYNEEISITILGFISGFMIISSLIQLTFEFTSFKSIIICNFLNAANLFIFLILICLCNASKHYIYIISAFIGFFIGFLYSANTKYSLLFGMRINGYLVSGISFCALFFFIINLLMSYLTIEDGNVKSYYNAITLSIGTVVVLKVLIIIYIIFMHLRSPYFLEQKERIESRKTKEINIDSELNTFNEVENGENNLSKGVSSYDKNSNDNDDKKIEVTVKDNISKISKINKKLKFPKKIFNCNNIIDGARLIKYYYLCLIPISFNIFITFVIYPHIIPNKLKKGVYYKYLFMFLFQCSDLIFSFLVTVYLNLFSFFKQQYVTILCICRILLLVLAYKIKNLQEDSFLYTNEFIAFVIFLVGSTNGSLINLSYGRICDCFKHSDQKEKNIAVSSSFCALTFLISFALSPWFCGLIIDS
ncbi:nucleoside transporter 4, putative [Plasmodium gallinaceum]|uniref:Nucleoside transporter 4, putative n=1 Tax=Plasmodium gallinaceum TaxID=5849 RepID=A0A1J1GLJ9_PLAGA|nr:nucleoside transporter 4, putative [Plasmodium gallinaceum]CRG93286.1 nucleoside transporter 4, putative [Plasmodium gallinaceum]